jgi:D-glycero-D-manno-heptose 1,7-bisphosphate phosphatase
MTTPPVAKPFIDERASAQLARATAPRRALFLDRDGVINVDHGYAHRPDQIEWVPGIFALCRAAIDAGFLPIVVTNQAGIARGFYDEAQFLAFTRWIHEEFARRGAPLLGTYYCPHHPDAGLGAYKVACDCRKPAPGMFRAALREFDLDAASSWMVGDKPGDIEAARAAGVGHAILLAAGTDASGVAGAAIAATLDEARAMIVPTQMPGRTPCGG